jgi:regulator of sirC expression with transglutaminase-like and TPR domain
MSLGPRARFAELAVLPDDQIDLATAALLIAAEAYPQLDINTYLRRLDDLAHEAHSRLEGARTDAERVAALTHFLSTEKGFTGNHDDYYDRRNSFFNEVLDRRTGIPITLALVYTEVGRRLGLAIRGVSFPGHFLAKVESRPEIIIDPFFGTVLDESQCHERLQEALGKDAPFDRRYLRAATTREFLIRMLNNLKHIYLGAKELERALSCCERILLLTPDNLFELRDRGLLYMQLECYGAARADLERFLELAPDDVHADTIRESLIEIRRHTVQIH